MACSVLGKMRVQVANAQTCLSTRKWSVTIYYSTFMSVLRITGASMSAKCANTIFHVKIVKLNVSFGTYQCRRLFCPS